jgi:aminopeptidase YwaD
MTGMVTESFAAGVRGCNDIAALPASTSIMRQVFLRLLLIVSPAIVSAHTPPLLPETNVAALVNEISGETAKRNLEGVARFHRQRGSQGFHEAAELIAERARAYGLGNVEILRFPTDGKTLYGTQRARLAWDAEEGELAEVVREGREVTLASYAAEPIVLAEDSESGEVTADLVDVGAGTKDADYAEKGVEGKLVLVSAQPSAVQDIAVGKYHAAGIVSYAQNQPTGWSGDNDNIIRWGHLDSFSAHKTFAFMVSLKVARGMQERLRSGKNIRLHARVKAGQHPGFYEVVTATIAGSDPKLAHDEIAFSCHLDHQRPGANDNASGCVTILEAGRVLQKLIAAGTLPRPARTLRFIWPPEIEGTVTLLNGRPDFPQRIKVVIHMDMVGGGVDTKAVFHVTRGPMSLPSFVHDVAWAFASWANQESYQFAATGAADYPLVAPEGGKEPLRAEYSPFEMGSDHQIYQDSSFAIPSIYLNDWPDRYIHTNFDTAGNIDPTKLKRAAFIGAASGYFLANFSARDVEEARGVVRVGSLLRRLLAAQRSTWTTGGLDASTVQSEYESRTLASVDAFQWPGAARAAARDGGGRGPSGGGNNTTSRDNTPMFHRRSTPRGPLAVFGYDYFEDHARAAGVPEPKLLSYQGSWGSGEEYAYEALNLADGRRSVQEIARVLSAEYGPVSADLVTEYFEALRRIGVVE